MNSNFQYICCGLRLLSKVLRSLLVVVFSCNSCAGKERLEILSWTHWRCIAQDKNCVRNLKTDNVKAALKGVKKWPSILHLGAGGPPSREGAMNSPLAPSPPQRRWTLYSTSHIFCVWTKRNPSLLSPFLTLEAVGRQQEIPTVTYKLLTVMTEHRVVMGWC